MPTETHPPPDNQPSVTLTVLSSPIDKRTGQTGCSELTERDLSLDDYNGLFISPRIDALNLRHRLSHAGYYSDWHMAGDPTLIIIRTGILRLGLRNGVFRDFGAGDMFIAKDKLHVGEVFNKKVHGHTAKVIGDDALTAVHVKLGKE